MGRTRQFVVENGTCEGKYLAKVERKARGGNGERTCTYKPSILDALVFTNKAEAVRHAEEWKDKVWEIKAGEPGKLVYPA